MTQEAELLAYTLHQEVDARGPSPLASHGLACAPLPAILQVSFGRLPTLPGLGSSIHQHCHVNKGLKQLSQVDGTLQKLILPSQQLVRCSRGPGSQHGSQAVTTVSAVKGHRDWYLTLPHCLGDALPA